MSWVWPAALKSFCILRLKWRFHVIFSLGSPAGAKSWSIFVQKQWNPLKMSKYTKNQSLFYGCLVAFGVRIQNRNRHIYIYIVYIYIPLRTPIQDGNLRPTGARVAFMNTIEETANAILSYVCMYICIYMYIQYIYIYRYICI